MCALNACASTGADPYRTSPGLETPLALLRKWAGADPQGEAAVRAIASTWEQNGGGDGADALPDDHDDDDDDNDEGDKAGGQNSKAELGSGKKGRRGSKDGAEGGRRASKDGIATAKRERDALDADRIDLDELYGEFDGQTRRPFADSDDDGSEPSNDDEDEAEYDDDEDDE